MCVARDPTGEGEIQSRVEVEIKRTYEALFDDDNMLEVSVAGLVIERSEFVHEALMVKVEARVDKELEKWVSL
jgi:hypothetical protein